MQQAENTQPWVAKDWPNDFDFREEIAGQQELLTCSDAICAAKERKHPTHSFEYDF